MNIENKCELWSAESWNQVSETYMQSFEDLENWAFEFEKENKQESKEGHELKSVA